MSPQATPTVEASATVSLRVPRGEAGDLEAGVADVLAAVDGVGAVDVEGVTGVRPTWTDIRVDADVAVTVEVGQADAAAAMAETVLTDGFGVTGVDRLDVDGAE